MKTKDELLDAAWGLLADVGGGDWAARSPAWREAAGAWQRDFSSLFLSYLFVGGPLDGVRQRVENLPEVRYRTRGSSLTTAYRRQAVLAGPVWLVFYVHTSLTIEEATALLFSRYPAHEPYRP